MNILPNVEIVNLALYLDNTLIISDVHIGYEEVLNRQGVLVPRLQFEDIAKSMQVIFSILQDRNIERIIVNGDLKHEFGTISEQEWRNTLKFLDLLAKHSQEIILIKGNHDTILGPIAKKKNIKVADIFILGSNKNKVLITHGDKIPDEKIWKEASAIIIGHEHPAISLKEGSKIETYKCFLKGKYKGRNLIAQPSFNTMIEGTDILKDKILSPYLQQNLDNFEVYVVEDKVYDFGKLRKLRNRV